jgi:hypothetical protein
MYGQFESSGFIINQFECSFRFNAEKFLELCRIERLLGSSRLR